LLDRSILDCAAREYQHNRSHCERAHQPTAIHYGNTNDSHRLGCKPPHEHAEATILSTFERILYELANLQQELDGTFSGVIMGRVQSKRRKVLIVEDDPEVRLLTKMVLEESELDVIECESGEAALATMLLQGQNVSMIFTDIHLSGEMDGIDLAHEVKIRWPHLVVILTSGNAGEHLKQMPPGVDYIPKPWQPLDVLIAAERARLSTGGR
jgi:CheY-like chemotaxis protein